MITMTPAAAKRIKDTLTERGKGFGLRVGVKTSGCSGYMYTLDYADTASAADQVFEAHGAKVVVSDEHLPLLDGTEIDYGREGLNEAFKFNNPNTAAECGCGESFTVA